VGKGGQEELACIGCFYVVLRKERGIYGCVDRYEAGERGFVERDVNLESCFNITYLYVESE